MDRGVGELEAEAASLFGWWEEAGVDMLVDERPRDWLLPTEPTSQPPRPPP